MTAGVNVMLLEHQPNDPDDDDDDPEEQEENSQEEFSNS
jgi:hypothetical protein